MITHNATIHAEVKLGFNKPKIFIRTLHFTFGSSIPKDKLIECREQMIRVALYNMLYHLHVNHSSKKYPMVILNTWVSFKSIDNLLTED